MAGKMWFLWHVDWNGIPIRNGFGLVDSLLDPTNAAAEGMYKWDVNSQGFSLILKLRRLLVLPLRSL